MDVDASLALVEAAAASFAASVRALESCGSLTAAQRQRLDDAKRKTQGSDVPATPQTAMSEPPTPQTRRERMANWHQQASANKSHRHLSRSLNFQSKLRLVADAHEEGRSPAVQSALKTLNQHRHDFESWCCKKKKRRRVRVQPTSLVQGENASQAILEMTAKQEEYEAANEWVFDPQSKEHAAWTTIIFLLVCYTMVVAPIEMAFYSNRRVPGSLKSINVVVELCFVIDLGLGFVTGYRRGAEVVMDLRLIALNYLRGWFWVDFIASIPLDTLSVLFGDDQLCIAKICKFIQMLKICKVFRMLKMLRVRDVVDETIDLGWLTPGTSKMLSIVFVYFLAMHFIGCAFWGVARHTENKWDGDVAKYRRFAPPEALKDASVGRQILFALHWAVLERASAFLFHPTARPNLLQSVFLIGVKIVAIAFIAIIIGQVKAVMEEISSDDPDKKAQLKVLDRYLERHAVPQEARTKARAHLIFMHNRLLTAKYTGLLAKLPPRLRTHVEAAARVQVLGRCRTFAPAKKTMALLAVARCMRDELHGPGDHVFDQEAPADGLRVVADGRLFTFQRATPWPKLLVFCGNNDAIGDDCCLHTSAKVWLYGCSAKSHSQVYFVPLSDLLHIVEEYAVFRTAANAAAKRSYDRLVRQVAAKVIRPKFRMLLARKWRGRGLETS